MSNITFEPAKNRRGYKITIMVDDPDSWIWPWAKILEKTIAPYHDVHLVSNKTEMNKGDFAFLLGCIQIIPKSFLGNHKYNIVAHESALPLGRGWSSLSWQVLEGKNIKGILKVLQACRDYDIERVIVTSTSGVFESPKEMS